MSTCNNTYIYINMCVLLQGWWRLKKYWINYCINERFDVQSSFLEKYLFYLWYKKKKSTKTHPWHVPSLKKCSFNRPHKFHRLVLLNKYISSALCLSTSAKSMLFSLSKISVRSLLHISACEHVVHVIYLVCVNVFHMPLAHFMK